MYAPPDGGDEVAALESVALDGVMSAVPLNSRPSVATGALAVVDARSGGSVKADLMPALQVMEARKSVRRYRGTQEPTRPGVTWALFGLFLLSMLYIPELSGAHDAAPYPTATDVEPPAPGEITYWLAVFGFSFNGKNPGNFEAILGFVLLFGFLLVCYIIIKAQVYYRLTLANYLLAALILINIIGRSQITIDNMAPAVVIGPAIVIMFFIYVTYILATLFLWHQLPGLQQQNGWFMPRILSKQAFRTPAVVQQMIEDIYQNSSATQPMGHGQAAMKITYCGWSSSFLPASLRKQLKRNFTVTYAGEVDEQGRPHGYGEWNDNYSKGEVLTGWWAHGVPFGPFRSRESGSGAGFQRVLQPYFRNRTDTWNTNNGKLDYGPITVGICQVECCTAGIFFREYPKCSEFFEVEPSGSVQKDVWEMLEKLNSMPMQLERLTSLVVQGDLQRGVLISGLNTVGGAPAFSATVGFQAGFKLPPSLSNGLNEYLAHTYRHRMVAGDSDEEDTPLTDSDIESQAADTASQEARQRSASQPRLQIPVLTVEGWERSTQCENCEALVFLPGFNSMTAGSAAIMAQLLALGNFPSYIKTVIYSWPGGNLGTYPVAQTKGAESERTAEDLKQLLLALNASGISKFHIVTHSMGIRVLTAAIPQLEELFLTSPVQSGVRLGQMQLCTITMLNTEMGRHEFVDCYARRLTAMSPCVTLYADALDTALFGAELQNSVLKWLFPKRRAPKVHEDLSKAPEEKRKARASNLWEYSLGRIKKDLLVRRCASTFSLALASLEPACCP